MSTKGQHLGVMEARAGGEREIDKLRGAAMMRVQSMKTGPTHKPKDNGLPAVLSA